MKMSSQNGPSTLSLRLRWPEWWSGRMHLDFDLIGVIGKALKAAAPAAGIESATFDPGVKTSDPRHGDFQANGVLAAARSAGRPPRPMAEGVAGALGPEVRVAFGVPDH